MSPAKRKTSGKKPASKSAKKTTASKKASSTSARAPAKTSARAKPGNGEFFDHNVEVARELASIAKRNAVSELIYETDALTLTIRRGEVGGPTGPQLIAAPAQMAQMPQMVHQPAPVAAAPAAAADEAVADDNLHVVTSPFVGTFYRSPSPEAPSYCEAGAAVTKGQILCIVEAMKLMNEIEADINGTIKTILVKNGESVEYGQPLFKIEPA